MGFEFLRDSIWNFIGAILTVLLPIIIFLLHRYRNRKELSYEVYYKLKVLSNKDILSGEIKIFYDEKEVENVNIFVLKFINNGNVAILSEDFEENLRLVFSEKAKVLSTAIVGTDPKYLKPNLQSNENIVEVQPLLLNRKDFFYIKAIVSDASDEVVSVEGRIKDIRMIKKDNKINTRKIDMKFGILGLVLTLFGVLQYVLNDQKIEIKITPLFNNTVSILLIILGYCFAILPNFIRRYFWFK